MSFINELFKSFARTLGRILVYVAISFLLMLFFTSKSNASSYYFDAPRIHNFCDTNKIGYCNTFNRADTKYLDPGFGVGNYYNVLYRADTNINNVSGNTFLPGVYSVSFSGALRSIDGTSLDINLFKIRLLYFPNSNNEYAIATCDNNESFTINKDNSNDSLYWYSYSCESLQITEGKSFIGWNIYLDLPSINLVKYFEYAQINTNLTLIGEGEATNNDIINNNNQNTDKVIGAIDDLNDAINSTEIPGVDNFNYTDPNAGIITSFLTMPLTLLRVMSNTNTCQSVNLGKLYGHPLILECVHPEEYLGNNLWTIIDYFIVFVMIGNIAQLFIYIYEKIKNLDDFFGEFYTPKHTKEGYTPRHGG